MLLADPARAPQAEEGLQAAREALALARRLGQDDAAAKAGAWLARHCLHLGGRFQAALEHATDILQAEASTAPPEVRVQAMCVIALAGCELSDFERALDAAQALMGLTSQVTDADTALGAAFSMAACFDRMGDAWQAVRLLSEALAEHAPRGSDRAVMTASNAMCAICPRVAHLLRDCGAETERQELLVRGREAGELALRLAQAQSNRAYAVAIKINLSENLIAQQERGAPRQGPGGAGTTRSAAAARGGGAVCGRRRM